MERWAIIVCGSRDWENFDAVASVLASYGDDLMIVIHGDAPGADECAAKFCVADGLLQHIAMPAQWARYGKIAGPRRNLNMLNVLLALADCGYSVRVDAFSLPQSKGTKDMKEIAAAAGVEVREHGGTRS